MAEFNFYGMFDYSEGDESGTYEYTSSEFSKLIEALTGNGVSYGYGNKLAATSSGLTVTIQSGAVFINGRYAYNDSAATVSCAAVATGTTRKDLILARLDVPNRKISIEVKQGTAADYPTCDSNEIPLWQADIANGAATLTDARQYVYTSSLYPTSQVIYSVSEPPVVNGAIWLQPIE